MDKFPTRVRVTTSRVSDHIDDIRFAQGACLMVGHRNQQYPEFVWCATEDGRAGWVPDAFLAMIDPHCAEALRDYDASHLTVARGESLEALERVGEWVLCRNRSAHTGWVRADALEEIPEPDGE